MKFKINNLVDAFGPNGKRYRIPATVARTVTEHAQLRSLIQTYAPHPRHAIEYGCGWGRMLPVLLEVSPMVFGEERDERFRSLAEFYYPVRTGPNGYFSGPFDLAITHTFLQHLTKPEDIARQINSIRENVTGVLILCEEAKDQCKSTAGRKPTEYAALLPEFELIYTEKRRLEADAPPGLLGFYTVFKRK